MIGFVIGVIVGAGLGTFGIGIMMAGAAPSARDSAYSIKGMCSEHDFCGSCPAFCDNECVFEGAPLTWKADKIKEEEDAKE